MEDSSNKRRRGDDDDFGRGRGLGRSFGGDRGGRGGRGGGNFGSGDRQEFRGGRGGGGNFRGGRGGGHSDFQHKTAGGDAQRMPDSTKNERLVPQKLAPGTEGRPVELIGNFYRIMHSQMMTVVHYDVTIEKVPYKGGKPLADTTTGPDGEDLPPASGDKMVDEAQLLAQNRFLKKFAEAIMAAFAKSNTDLFFNVHFAYDGWKNLYTTRQLNSDDAADLSQSVELSIDGRSRTFLVTLKQVDSVAMGEALDYYNGKATSKPVSERIISVFEVIFRFVISKAFPTYQRKFFDLEAVEHSPKARLVDFVQGFIDSVRMTEFGLALNIHLKTSAIISKRFTDLFSLVCEVLAMSPEEVEDCCAKGGFTRQRISAANKILRHLKVFTKHGKREIVYTVDGLVVNMKPKEAKFEDKEGKLISIHEYFSREYNITLKDLPLMKVTGKKILVPLELCYFKEAQFLNKTKFDSNIQREMLFKSTHTPNVYFHKVAKVVDRIQAADKDGLLKKFGLDIVPKAARFEGRVLPAPRTQGSGQRDRFFMPARSPSWGVFCFDMTKNSPDLKNFCGQIIQKAGEFGLKLHDPTFMDFVRVKSLQEIGNIFDNVTKRTNAELIFVGIPIRHDALSSSEMYSMVKHCCDQRYGIMTQCFKSDNVTRPPAGYFDNILLKVNGKCGGQNVSIEPRLMENLPFKLKETMIIGVDVNHPGETERVMSSVAAAVGSYDDTFSRYNASIWVQRKEGDETVRHLNMMVADLLRQYKSANGHYPSTLVIFRDGVSEGQFARITEIELALVRRACDDVIGSGNKVKIVLIVVQKRHHTRFALATQNTQGRKPTYNVPSGTVVDRDIVDPSIKSFYLNSHFSPLGTSKPTKYVILHDDLSMNADAIQKLCFYSCFNSTRTRNVIALPTAVRYADLAAYRAKLHIEARLAFEMGSKIDTTTLSSGKKRAGAIMGPSDEELIIVKLNCEAQLHEKVKHQLFYC